MYEAVKQALEETLPVLMEASVDTGVADDTSTVNQLDDSSKSWPVNAFTNLIVEITDGTGEGQMRKISANTATSITPTVPFDTAPDGTSKYRIGFFGKMASDITAWGGTALTGRDISLDLAKIPEQTASGNTPISVEEAAIQVPSDLQSQYKPLLDSTTSPLAGGATYTGSSVDVSRYSRLTGIIFADQDCTLYIDHSGDGSNWDYSSEFSVSASTGLAFSIEAIAGYVRLRIVNGAAAQSVLRAYLYGRVV